MKKIYFAIAACAIFAFAACNNSTGAGEGDSTAKDSTPMATEETTTPPTTGGDSATMGGDSAKTEVAPK
jgi:predicted small secreted protein